MINDERDKQPWFRQFWFWFVMTPLIVVICVVLTFVGVSFFHADDRVVDSYYKEGRAINQTFEQQARAHARGMVAQLRFDLVTEEVFLELTGEGALPEFLYLTLGHPVEADLDERVHMQQVREGRYRGTFKGQLRHRRYLTLLPEVTPDQIRDADWLLRGEINFANADRVELSAPASGEKP